jgi:hypothetical protein
MIINRGPGPELRERPLPTVTEEVGLGTEVMLMLLFDLSVSWRLRDE